MLVSRKRQGACHLLRWSDERRRYVCGLLADAGESDGGAGELANAGALSAPSFGRRLWRAWARRLISAGSGCDASIEVAVEASEGSPGQK